MNNHSKTRDRLVEEYLKVLKEDEIPWQKTWRTSDTPFNPITKIRYRGINRAMLDMIALQNGYEDPRWMTFNQIKAKGYRLINAKGQGVPVEFWTLYDVKSHQKMSIKEYKILSESDPERLENIVWYVQNYTVFNGQLIEGLEPYQKEQYENKEVFIENFTENLIKNMKVDYEETGDRAFYSQLHDKVTVPSRLRFKDSYSFNATLLHELAHATSHPFRLNRKLGERFGDPQYAKEELRAEISSSFLTSDLQLSLDEQHLKNHKAYIQHWINIIQNDSSELFKAINDAEKITDYMKEVGEFEKIKSMDTYERLQEELTSNKLSLDDYLNQKGLSAPLSGYVEDKLRCNRQINTQHGLDRFQRDAMKNIDDYHDKRTRAIQEYNELVNKGLITPKSNLEISLEHAKGCPTLTATQAAKRMAAKRGYDWRTENKFTDEQLQIRDHIQNRYAEKMEELSKLKNEEQLQLFQHDYKEDLVLSLMDKKTQNALSNDIDNIAVWSEEIEKICDEFKLENIKQLTK